MFRLLKIALFVAAGAGVMSWSSASAAGSWTRNHHMAEGRVLIQAASIGTDVYIAGGSNVAGPRASFDLYDSANDMWRPLPPMPTARERFGMAGSSGRIYISGGRSREMDEAAPSASDELWVYDTVSGDWVTKAAMPSKRVDHVMVNVGDKLYVIGGSGQNGDLIYAYDIVSNTWTTLKTRMPKPRRNFGVAFDQASIYIIGGISNKGKILADVDVFNAQSESWTKQSPMQKPRAGVAAAFLGGRLHVAGGSTPDPAQTFNEHLSRKPDDTSWRTEPELPTARHTAAYVQTGDKWIVLGGGAAAGFYTLFSAADAVEAFRIN